MSQDKGFLDGKKTLEPNQNQPVNDNAGIPRATVKTPWQLFCTDVLAGYAASKTIEDEVAELFEGSYHLANGPSNT
jgi:hypothetical protein